jgi:hypothetical protein
MRRWPGENPAIVVLSPSLKAIPRRDCEMAPSKRRRGAGPKLPSSTFAEAAYCQAYGMWRTAEELLAREGLTVRGDRHAVANPLQKIAAQAARDLIRYGNEFALTPSARARVAACHQPPRASLAICWLRLSLSQPAGA